MSKKILLIVARAIWLFARAAATLFLAVHAVVGVIGGWKPFWEQADEWGVLAVSKALLHFVANVLTTYGGYIFLILVILALLIYILIDRPKQKSRAEFEEHRKQTPTQTAKPRRRKKGTKK